jgi:3-deoxy-D-manno-octulosonic-acid transferase
MAYWIYNVVVSAVFMLMLPAVPFFCFHGRRLLRGFPERLGFYSPAVLRALGGTRPVWIHAVSVGEVLAGSRLQKGLKESFPGKKILLSTSTATGREMAQKTMPLPDGMIYFPLDLPWVVSRALDRFDPCLVVFLEKEVWPNFLRLSHRRGIPVALISGRLSPRSFRRYALFRPLFSRALQYFSAVGMQSREDAERMARLGVCRQRVAITGNLKHDLATDALGAENGAGRTPQYLKTVEHRPVLVAGSTHEGEEEILLEVFLSLKSRFPLLLMVLAPRHPHRFGQVERLLRQKEIVYEKKSRQKETGQAFDVLLLDSMGELAHYYSLADIAFVGGSLIDAGGHNLLEPARFGKPVVFGPHVANVAETAEEMKRKGCGLQVNDEEDLRRAIADLLSEPERAAEMGRRAQSLVEEDRAVVRASLRFLSRYLVP